MMKLAVQINNFDSRMGLIEQLENQFYEMFPHEVDLFGQDRADDFEWSAIEIWAKEHLSGTVTLSGTMCFAFQTKEDAVLFKMRWS